LCFFSILLSASIFGRWKSARLIWAIAYLDGYRWFSLSWDDWRTRHREILPTPKLNSSDSQYHGEVSFAIPLQERVTPALFKNVMPLCSWKCNMHCSSPCWLIKLLLRVGRKFCDLEENFAYERQSVPLQATEVTFYCIKDKKFTINLK
jgi:hypothetical protein